MIEPSSSATTLSAPDDVIELAEQRARARSERDWASADQLKERIAAAGWTVVDDGIDYRLAPIRPPDVVVGDRTLYGHVESVPSLLGVPATSEATVVVVADADDETLAQVLAATSTLTPPGTGNIVVLDGSHGIGTGGLEAAELVLTAGPFTPGAALQAGARRATGAVIVALLGRHIPEGDFVGPLLNALADPAVAVAGAGGLRSADLHRFEPAGPGPVTALTGACLAFRRADLVARGPLDDRLRLADSVATWWSLVLRDEGEDASPRSALAIDLPLSAGDPPRSAGADTDDDGGSADHAAAQTAPRDRRAKRDRYRISDRFGGRSDLATI